MNDKQLLQLIHNTKQKLFTDYGMMVDFSDIFIQLRDNYGIDNKDLLELKIREFEKQGLLKAVYMKDPGFEELLIGIKPNP